MQSNDPALITNSLAEIQVSYSINIPKNKRLKILRSRDAENILRMIWEPNTIEYKEKFYAIYLNHAADVLGFCLHGIGSVSEVIVDVKQIIGIALKTNASSIILAHNHPSSNIRPSNFDIDLTKRIAFEAAYFDINILDHLILSLDQYYSFADEGIMPIDTMNDHRFGVEANFCYKRWEE